MTLLDLFYFFFFGIGFAEVGVDRKKGWVEGVGENWRRLID
jgi:hypothetical protein